MFSELWHTLTTPPANLEGEARRQARLLMSMLVVLIVVSVPGGIYSLFQLADSGELNTGFSFVIITLITSFFIDYFLCRAGYYRPAAMIFVLSPTAVISLGAILSQGESTASFLYFLIMSPILSSLLLSTRETVVIGVTNLLVIYALVNVVPGWRDIPAYGYILFNLGVMSLVAVSAYVREQQLKQIAQQVVDLERANQVKSAFLASMSHELRTPLNAIINLTQFVVEGDYGDVNEEQADNLNQVINSSRHLLSLINDVLDMSRIQSGSLMLFVEDGVDLSSLLKNVISLGKGLLADKPVNIETHIEHDLPLVRGDRQRIFQIMLNIMSNAAKFTNHGVIHISARRVGNEIYIEFADNGPGIPTEDQTAVFEAFRQTNSGLRAGGGSGLGMPISKSLAEAHGGRLRLQSQLGKGSVFTVVLPVCNEKLVPLTQVEMAS